MRGFLNLRLSAALLAAGLVLVPPLRGGPINADYSISPPAAVMPSNSLSLTNGTVTAPVPLLSGFTLSDLSLTLGMVGDCTPGDYCLPVTFPSSLTMQRAANEFAIFDLDTDGTLFAAGPDHTSGTISGHIRRASSYQLPADVEAALGPLLGRGGDLEITFTGVEIIRTSGPFSTAVWPAPSPTSVVSFRLVIGPEAVEVPEPTTAACLLVGLAGLVALRARRRAPKNL